MALASDGFELFEARREAMIEVFGALPLQFENATPSVGQTAGYGLVEARDSNRYVAGETAVLYAELLGHRFRRVGNVWAFGIVADAIVKAGHGKVIAEVPSFMCRELANIHRAT